MLKTGNFKSLTRKPSYSSFFSVLFPELKNVFFRKIHWAPSEVVEVKRPFSRSRRPNFGFYLFLMSFDLEFSLFWVSRLFDLGDLGDLKKSPVNVFKNYIFEISGFYWSKYTVECAIRLTLISKSAQARGVWPKPLLGLIPKPNPKLADFSWWLFEIIHIICFEMHMDRPKKSANIFGI